MKSFAILVICFNRVNGIERLVNSLKKVDYDSRNDIDLIFSIDFSGNNAVADYVKTINWNHGKKIVINHKENLGLKKHILKCGDFTNDYDILVVLEDDIVVSPSLYYYAYQAACFYENDDKIAGISLYSFEKNWVKTSIPFNPLKTESDVFFMKIAQSWGQVWQREKWKAFITWLSDNTVIKNNKMFPWPLNSWNDSTSWLKYHDIYCIQENKYFVYPYKALSTNCSDSGTHNLTASRASQVNLQGMKKNYSFIQIDNQKSIKYDEYMEAEHIFKYLNNDINENCFTNDLHGNKPIEIYKRYVLSSKRLNYLIVKQFGLSFFPIEMNIVYNVPGSKIFLYDTSIRVKNKHRLNRFELQEYYLRLDNANTAFSFLTISIRFVFHRLLMKLKGK